jgi:hypothetical protein
VNQSTGRARVFVPQQPSRYDHEAKMRIPTVNLSPATEYGELVSVIPAGLSAQFYAPIVATVRDKLRDMTYDDYIVPVGDPILIAIVTGMALKMHGRVRLLRWDRETKRYTPIEVEMV